MKIQALWIAALIVCAASQARAAVMTFDPLPSDGQAVSDYSEVGIRLRNGARHFHEALNTDNKTTGAIVEASDGIPIRISLVSGARFTLKSIEIFLPSVPPSFVFRSSSGAQIVLGDQGVATFPSGFTSVSFVDIISATEGGLGFDNIIIALPEPTGLLAAVPAVAALIRRRARVAFFKD